MRYEHHELPLDKLEEIATKHDLLLSDPLINFAHDVLNQIHSKKEVKVYFSEEDCQELLNGEEFHWVFDDVPLHIIQGNEDDQIII